MTPVVFQGEARPAFFQGPRHRSINWLFIAAWMLCGIGPWALIAAIVRWVW
jgi:hypothetical protein